MINNAGRFIRFTFCCALFSAAIARADVPASSADTEEPRAGLANSETRIANDRLVARLNRAKEVFQELLNASDGGVPQSLLQGSNCIAVLPDVLKAAFIFGGEYGKGVLSCKTSTGAWSAPGFIELASGSFGWQIGGESTDLVLFFAGEQSKDVLSTAKFTLGGDIGISAGPVGRSAEGNLGPRLNGVYSYAHSQGLFAGLALKGAVLNPDIRANKQYYARADVGSFVLDDVTGGAIPTEASAFVQALPQ